MRQTMTSPICSRTSAWRSCELAFSLLLAVALQGQPAWSHDLDDVLASSRAHAAGARGLLQAFRESGDDRFLDEAWILVRPELAGDVRADALIDAALVAQARHRFDEAGLLVARALDLEPGNDQAWLLINSISLVQGRDDEASNACRQLRRAEPLAIVTCHARVALVRGDAATVLPRLEAVMAVGATESRLLAWSHSVAGDLAVALDADVKSIRHYRASLGLAESTQVRSALVDVLIRAGRLPEARLALDAGSHHALPLQVRRLIVDRLDGRASQHRVNHVDERFKAWIDAGDRLHAREMARFYLDVKPEPELALELATVNIELQKEPEDYRLLRRASVRVATSFRDNG